MTKKKLNWRDPADYTYMKKLNTMGWAWEFIRRSEAYRNAYKEMKDAVQDAIPHPPKKKGESENAWKMRLAGRGEIGRYLTAAQILARKEWGLCKMYDPDAAYNADKHLFDLNNPFPVFYGQPREIEGIKDKKERERVGELFQKEPKLLAGLNPLNEIGDPLNDTEQTSIVFIALDANRPLMHQLKKAEAFLKNYQRILEAPLKLGRERRAEWTRYIRMLDAEAAEGKKISQKEKIEIIDPSRKGGVYNEVNGYAHDTLNAAREMTDSGYKKLLVNLSIA